MSSLLLPTLLLSALNAETVELRSSRLALTLSQARRGAIVSLRDHASGTEFANRESAQDLFLIAYTKPGDKSGKFQCLASHSAEDVQFRVTPDRGDTFQV